MKTKENVDVGGIIVKEYGANYLIVVDAAYDSSTPLPIVIPDQTTTVRDAIGYEVL